MRFKLKCVVFVIATFELTFSSRWFRDTSLDNKTYLLGCGVVTRSLIHCADACAANSTCKSFFFAKGHFENCMILSVVLVQWSPNIGDLEGSAYYIMTKTPGIVFRSTVGIGSQFEMAEAWLAAGPGTTSDTSCRNVMLDGCSKHYRHPIVDDWATLNPQQLRYSIYKDEIEVVWVLFDARGSNKTNWFHQSRVLGSSYTDLTPYAVYNKFSIDPGDAWLRRHFYVNENWGGCENDYSWFCTFDNSGVCNIDNYGNWPYIVYSKLSTKAHHGNMALCQKGMSRQTVEAEQRFKLGDFGFGDCSVVTVVS